MSPETIKAINQLYKVFSKYPKPRKIYGCPCCIEDIDQDALATKPLRTLTQDDLSGFTLSILSTVGCEEDFKYFLPRIMELTITEFLPDPGPEIVLSKFHDAEWDNWPEAEKQAVMNSIHCTLTDLINEPRYELGYDLGGWICGIARYVNDITPYLNQLKRNSTSLAYFHQENSNSLHKKGKLSSGFWDDVPEAHDQVVKWLKSQEILKIINKHYEKF